jgi:hypothetical protein
MQCIPEGFSDIFELDWKDKYFEGAVAFLDHFAPESTQHVEEIRQNWQKSQLKQKSVAEIQGAKNRTSFSLPPTQVQNVF